MSGVSFIIILLSLVGALTTLGFILKKRMILSSHCVHSVLKLQKDLARPLDRLLKLNKPATKLRIKSKIAKARLAAALGTGNPPAIALARAQLLVIQKKQLILKGRQQALLMEARVRREQFHLLHSGKDVVDRQSRFPGETSDLAVKPLPPGSLSPSYQLSANFFEEQGQSYRIKQRLRLPLIGFVRFITDQKDIHLQTSCSASLRKKGIDRWTPILKKVKAQWRLSYGSF